MTPILPATGRASCDRRRCRACPTTARSGDEAGKRWRTRARLLSGTTPCTRLQGHHASGAGRRGPRRAHGSATASGPRVFRAARAVSQERPAHHAGRQERGTTARSNCSRCAAEPLPICARGQVRRDPRAGGRPCGRAMPHLRRRVRGARGACPRGDGWAAPAAGGHRPAGGHCAAGAAAAPRNGAPPSTSASLQPRPLSRPVVHQVCASIRSGPRTRSWKRTGSR